MAGTGYRAQPKEMPFDADQPLFRDGLEKTDKYLAKLLDGFGVDAERELRDGPAAGSVPRVFLFEDGKLGLGGLFFGLFRRGIHESRVETGSSGFLFFEFISRRHLEEIIRFILE